MSTLLALTRYRRLGSSSRVRFYQYFPHLQANGFEVVEAPFFDDEYIRGLYAGRRASVAAVLKAYAGRLASLSRNRNIDILWAEKELLPWLPFGLETVFPASRIPLVVDYDDAVFHRYDLHPNPLVRTFLGQKIDRVMRRASMVVAGNEYIADRARSAGARRVELLPSVVDVEKYSVKEPEADSVFKVGWIGAPVTAPHLDLAREALSKFSRESAIRLVLVGAGEKPPFAGIPAELLRWSEELERTVNQRFDVGIMPLPDSPFERGKCGYKLIQYMAGGLPVIASPVGVNRQIVEPGVNGYLADTSAEWLDALRTLRDDPRKRAEMGRAGRRKAEKNYNLRVTAPKLLDLLKSVLRS